MASRHFLLCAIGYALLPFDLIPDAIPILGHLDDAVIVPGLIWLALSRVPKEVLEACRTANIGACDKPCNNSCETGDGISRPSG